MPSRPINLDIRYSYEGLPESDPLGLKVFIADTHRPGARPALLRLLRRKKLDACRARWLIVVIGPHGALTLEDETVQGVAEYQRGLLLASQFTDVECQLLASPEDRAYLESQARLLQLEVGPVGGHA